MLGARRFAVSERLWMQVPYCPRLAASSTRGGAAGGDVGDSRSDSEFMLEAEEEPERALSSCSSLACWAMASRATSRFRSMCCRSAAAASAAPIS